VCRQHPKQSALYLLAKGSTQSTIDYYFIVVDKHALPCKAKGSVGHFDKLFKDYYVFGTSYCSSVTNYQIESVLIMDF